jgi:hypothetical protein
LVPVEGQWRIGNLRSIDEHFVEIYREFLGISHGRKQYPAPACLEVNIRNILTGPVGIGFESMISFYDLQSPCGTQ